MTDPPRLFDVKNHPFEQALLGSAQQDRGSSAAQLRCVAAVGTAVFAATQATTAVAAATTATAVGGSAVSAIAVKGILIGLILGASIQGAVIVTERVSAKTTSHQVTTEKSRHGQQGIAKLSPISSTVVPALKNKALTETTERRLQENPAAIVTSLPGDSKRLEMTKGLNEPQTLPASDNNLASSREVLKKNDLAREVALLEEARTACIERRFDWALQLVEHHRREFTGGALAPEALVIQVRALLGQNRKREAYSIARPFIKENPSSPVTIRLKTLVSDLSSLEED
jgi:hypothetical protein